MRKILNSNVFLGFVLFILISIIVYILFDEYERNRNINILNNLVKKEKGLQNIKAAYEALLKDMEEEENIETKNDSSNSGTKNSENDNKEIINSEDDNKENISSENEEKLANGSDKNRIIKCIDELNNIINENDAQIIAIFQKKARLSKGDRETLEKINMILSESLDKYGTIYNQLALRKKSSLEMEKNDIEKGK